MKVWEDGFYPEQVHTEQFCVQKMEYMHNNPLRAGFVDDASHRKHSSAGFYYQDAESVAPIEPLDW